MKHNISTVSVAYRSDLHGHRNSAFDGSADVVAVPRGDLWDIWEDSYQNEEASEVLHGRFLHSNEDDETNNPVQQSAHFTESTLSSGKHLRNHGDANNVHASCAVLVSHETHANCEDACQNVWWYSQELSGLVSVSHASNNSGQEYRDTVERAEVAKRHETIDPNLPILERIYDEFGAEFVGKSGVVVAKSSYNFYSLFLGQEFGGIGIVVQVEECNAG